LRPTQRLPFFAVHCVAGFSLPIKSLLLAFACVQIKKIIDHRIVLESAARVSIGIVSYIVTHNFHSINSFCVSKIA